MDRDVMIERLRDRWSDLKGLGVRRLVLFGPAARGEGAPGGEVNFLVELAPPLTFERYLAARDFLAGLLERTVELVLENIQHPNIWPYVQDDAIEI
jgi:predicted nucleotidyltransferase